MPKFQTIQKVADDLGIGSSLIHTLIKDGEISKFRLKGKKRVLIDRLELDALIVPVNEQIDFQFDSFKV